MRSKMRIAVLLTLSLLVLPGCGAFGAAELSDRLIVEAIGIDAGKNGVTVSLSALDLHAAAKTENAGGAGKTTSRYAFEGENVSDALANAAAATGLEPLYSQARVLVLGAGARERDIMALLEPLLRKSGIRNDILICAGTGTAKEIVFARLTDAGSDARVLEDVIARGAKEGSLPSQKLFRFADRLLSARDAAVCPVLSLEKNEEEKTVTPIPDGAIVFRTGAPPLSLPQSLVRGLLFLTGKLRACTLTVRSDKKPVTLRLSGIRTTGRLERGAGALCLRLRWRAGAELLEGAGTDRNARAAAAHSAARRLTEEAAACFRYLSAERGADICRIARRAQWRGIPLSEAQRAETKLCFSGGVKRKDGGLLR